MKSNKDFSSFNSMIEIPKLTEKDVSGYVLERFVDLKKDPTVENLVKYHTNNKYLIMAHNQIGLKELGNIVANHKKLPLKCVLKIYEKNLIKTLEKKPTIKSHINVLMHIFGYFKKQLNQQEKIIFLQFIKDYRSNKMTLGRILSEIEPITYKFNNLYLMSQTYFLLYSDTKIGNEFKFLASDHFDLK